MSTANPDLKERMAAIQKEADKIGPVDPKFNQKTFSDDLRSPPMRRPFALDRPLPFKHPLAFLLQRTFMLCILLL